MLTRHRFLALLAALLTSTGCTCSWLPADNVLPFLDARRPVSYDGASNVWADAQGAFGWSVQEDSDLCLFTFPA